MEKRAQYKTQYRVEWENDDTFKGWILPVSDDCRKAMCKCCKVQLPACHANLCLHASDKNHLMNASAAESSVGIESLADQVDEELMKLDSNDAKENKKALGFRSKSKSKQNARNGIKYQRRWLLNPLFSGWLQPVTDDSSKANCSYCYTELRAHYKDLERHAKTKKHIAHTQSSSAKDENLKSGCFETGDGSEDLAAVNNTEVAISSQPKTKSQKLLHKQKSKCRIDWSRYKKIYHQRWELDPALSGWIAPVTGDKYKASCKFCGCLLRAHYTDLQNHQKTTKHLKNASRHENGGPEPVVIGNGKTRGTGNFALDKSDGDRHTEESSMSKCTMLSKDRLLRSRKYRKQWEQDHQFQGWITSVPGNDKKAFCKCCHIQIRAHLTDLKSHGKTTKHANNSRKRLLNSLTSRHMAVIQPCSSLKPTFICRKSTNAMAKRSQYKIHYRTEWESDETFKDWILPVSDDHRKAQCKYCKVQLPAHHAGLCFHALDKKHLKNASTAGNAFRNESLPDGVNDKFSDARNTEASFGHKSTLMDNSKVNERKIKANSEKSVDVKSSKRVSFLTPEEHEDASEFLELVCEAVDEKSVAMLLNASTENHNQKQIKISPDVQGHLKQSERNSILKRKDSRGSSFHANSVGDKDTGICDSAAGDANSVETNSVILSAVETKKLKSSNTELFDADIELHEPTVKRRRLNKIPDTESSADEAIILEVKRELQDDDVLLRDTSSESVFNKPEILRKKRQGSKSKIDWRRYKKTYRREWEMDPNLSDWVAPIDGDKYKAACRFCGCVLRAHYTDLQQHRTTAKHTRNAYWYKIKAANPDAVDSCMTREDFSGQKDDGCNQTKESKVSACYMLSKSPWSRYRKRYRKQWESDPQFQGWIASVPGDDTKARCKYCCILLRAHFADLKNHSRTTKHANNIAYGRPFPDSSVVNRPGLVHTSTSLKQTVISRKKKSSVKSVSALNKADDDFDLNRPDDSLAPIGNLTNITTYGWCSSSLPETTLILPKHVHLDETLAASLPKTSPATMFRVKKEPSAAQTSPIKKRKEKLQVQTASEECTENALQNLTKSVTLWEFLMMKVEKSHPNCTRPKLETILLEFKALQEQVKSLGQQQLIPMASDEKAIDSRKNDIIVIESEELAHCLGVPVGEYKIKDPTNPRMNRNISLLSNIPRRRTKQSSTVGNTTVSHTHDHMVVTNSVQKLMAAGDSEIQSLVIQSDQLPGVKFIGYDFDRQYTDCSNLFTVNGHYEGEGDVQLYVVPISEDVDQETLNTIMQGVPVTK